MNTLAAGSTVTYRQSIRQALKDRIPELSDGEQFAIRVALFLPFRARRLENQIFNEAQVKGLIPEGVSPDDNIPHTVGSPDWEKFFSSLGNFIQVIFPFIMQLLPYLIGSLFPFIMYVFLFVVMFLPVFN